MTRLSERLGGYPRCMTDVCGCNGATHLECVLAR